MRANRSLVVDLKGDELSQLAAFEVIVGYQDDGLLPVENRPQRNPFDVPLRAIKYTGVTKVIVES